MIALNSLAAFTQDVSRTAGVGNVAPVREPTAGKPEATQSPSGSSTPCRRRRPLRTRSGAFSSTCGSKTALTLSAHPPLRAAGSLRIL